MRFRPRPNWELTPLAIADRATAILVSASRGVLVPQCGVDAAVAEPLLPLGQRRPARAAIVARRAGGRAREGPGDRRPHGASRQCRCIVDGCRCQTPSRPGKRRASGPAPSSCRGGGRSQGRRAKEWSPPGSLPPTSSSPRSAHRRPRTARARPAPPPPRRRHPSAQLEHLTTAQGTPGAQQHERPKPIRHRLDDDLELLDASPVGSHGLEACWPPPRIR